MEKFKKVLWLRTLKTKYPLKAGIKNAIFGIKKKLNKLTEKLFRCLRISNCLRQSLKM